MQIAMYKSKRTQIPVWADEKSIIDSLKNGRMRRIEHDFYTMELLEKLFARIETLETCIDELVAGE